MGAILRQPRQQGAGVLIHALNMCHESLDQVCDEQESQSLFETTRIDAWLLLIGLLLSTRPGPATKRVQLECALLARPNPAKPPVQKKEAARARPYWQRTNGSAARRWMLGKQVSGGEPGLLVPGAS